MPWGFGGGVALSRIPAGESRRFELVIDLPATVTPGLLRGEVRIVGADGASLANVPLSIDVLPIDLKPVEGYYSIFDRTQSNRPQGPHHISEKRYRAQLADMIRHGLNTVTLYGGAAALPLAAEAGMTQPPCVMSWPDSRAAQDIARARQLGFPDVYFYGVDEPNSEAQLNRLINESERRRTVGVGMMAPTRFPTPTLTSRWCRRCAGWRCATALTMCVTCRRWIVRSPLRTRRCQPLRRPRDWRTLWPPLARSEVQFAWNGWLVRLCDFVSAGQSGRDYQTWLRVRQCVGIEPPFSRDQAHCQRCNLTAKEARFGAA